MRANPLKHIIWKQFKKRKGKLLVAELFMLGFTLTQLLSPWPLKIIFDHILLDKPLPPALSFLQIIFSQGTAFALVTVSLSIIVLALVRAYFSYNQLYLSSRIAYRLVHNIQRELFVHLQRLSLSFHQKARSGEIINRFISDTNLLRDAFSDWLMTLISNFFLILGMFTIMFLLNFELAVIVLATFPILLFSLNYLYQRIRQYSKKQRKNEGRVAAHIGEILSSIPLVQAFNREKYEEARFEEQSRLTLKKSIKRARMEAVMTRVVEVVSALGMVAVVIYGSSQVLQGIILPGDLLVFTAYLNSLYKPIKEAVKLGTKFSKALVSAERINKILKIEPEVKDLPKAIPALNIKGKVVFDAVSFQYTTNQKILNRVSFSVSSGQLIVLIGASGAGKSTIASLLLRLYDPTEGTIKIDDLDIRQYQRESLRSKISVVFQDAILFGASIRENIAYGKLEATDEEIVRAAKASAAHDFITGLPAGYNTVIGERGSTLSGGQKQRIALARAIIKPFSILILDEPTSSLDQESRQLIYATLEQIKKDKTVIMITHDKSAIIAKADKILMLENGRVLEKEKAKPFKAIHATTGTLYIRQTTIW